MHHDAPAALPLLGFVTGLAFGPALVQPRVAIAGTLAMAAATLLLRWPARTRRPLSVRRPSAEGPAGRPERRLTAGAPITALLALAAGIALAVHWAAARRADESAFASLARDVFVTVETPIDHGWSTRDGISFSLRARNFVANGRPFQQPIIVYTRFQPPPVGMSSTAVFHGFLRNDERGFYVMTVKSPLLAGYKGRLSPLSPARWNRMLADRVEPLAREYPVEVALVEALALGRGERIDDDIRDGFKRAGTYHLLVFSGLQIALAAGVLAWLLRAAHAPRASDWLLLTFAAVAPLFIGPTASVSRASVGIGLYAVSRIAKRPTAFENLWCVAALSELAIAPADLTDAAFHLTYAGAGAMLFIAKPLRDWRWIAAPLAAEAAIVPLTLFHFHQYAIGGSLMTALMTPIIFAMLIVAATACAFPTPAAMHVMGLLHGVCTRMNDAGGHASGFFAAPPVAVLAAAALAATAVIAALAGRRRAFALGAILLVPTAGAVFRDFEARRFEGVQVIALDVGQGDSIVVRSRDRVLLVDGGGRNESARFGETTLLPLLVDRGIHHIDAVALTHAHPDHCGGIPAVLEHLDARSMWITPRRFAGPCAGAVLQATIDSGTPIHLVRDRDTLPLGQFQATALVPESRFRRAAENNCSLVLRVQIGSRRLLMTGDIERETEGALLERTLRSDLLKVAHHGSRSSSTPPFLDAVAPRVAIISAGRHNLFGHPHQEVLESLRQRGIVLWRTDLNGTIAITLTDGAVSVRPEIDTPH